MRNRIMMHVDRVVIATLRRMVKDKRRLTRMEDSYYARTFWLLP